MGRTFLKELPTPHAQTDARVSVKYADTKVDSVFHAAAFRISSRGTLASRALEDAWPVRSCALTLSPAGV